ncbi:PVC-type heme-binding CxxCH protein [Pedobacter deserti]|uniref:PVC-type heme-binding CxxCH protein n=1 Tax=Pedobacter deserti TaxID=2817382 RepID=UPI0021098E49|nr:PVC-type heme-binding CxxCH protein [Pedobacter sp. SYSU D00382]
MNKPVRKSWKILFRVLLLFIVAVVCLHFTQKQTPPVGPDRQSHIVLVGNNLGSRMMNYGHFETELHLRYPDHQLFIRNMCDGGNTPGFRPHSSRNSPWAFPGAEQFQTELAADADSQGFFETEDQWLTRLKADVILAFFGYSESFDGPAGVENYRRELDAFVKHTLKQRYNGKTPPRLVLISPIAFQDLSSVMDLPDGKTQNANLVLYAAVMKDVAAENNVLFADLYNPSKQWFATSKVPLTIDGSQLTSEGYAKLAPVLADLIFGKATVKTPARREQVRQAVVEKNWMWHNDFKIPNGVHAYGRRYDPFGPDNYPAEIAKIRALTANRDTAVWQAARGLNMDLAAADARTPAVPEVKSNYNPGPGESLRYLSGAETLSKFNMAPGFKIDLFASEEQFPELAKPCQISFDNRGRLWVATMPSYPHYKPGDSKPNDKLIILEDTDQDGKADRQTVFADGLHLPLGFEVTAEGVYLSQGTDLVLLRDANGDDRADSREILLSGFDDHDTHHNIHAFTTDPSGAIYMGEGIFLHTNVETSYGPVRASTGGFYRYNPQRRHLERTAQPYAPNPWGIAFDDWGQPFYAETSSPSAHWMMPVTVRPRYGQTTESSPNLIQQEHLVRPTSGLEFVSSRHFPEEMQGDFLINNTIGFLGTKQHTLNDAGTGYKSSHRADLLQSSDKNFRPVDLEFAPDGSLYIADWHNLLIGHMQHNARDPLRDHEHGRIYRVTYPARPLVKPAKVAGASVSELLDNLKLPEYRTRYRTRNELRGRKPLEVLPKLKAWVAALDRNDPKYEHHLLEALWVSWGLNKVDQQLLEQLLSARDFRARAAAVRVLRYMSHQISNQQEMFRQAGADPHGRVRLEVIAAASWMPKEQGLSLLGYVADKPLDEWMKSPYETAVAHLNGRPKGAKIEPEDSAPAGPSKDIYVKGKAIYMKEGYCTTCHQPDGKGLPSSGFPPLAGTAWVTGSPDRLVKIILKGLQGPITVNGRKYSGQVPMTPFGGMLTDEEVAAVATYVRNAFGNKAPAISPEKVKALRAATKAKAGFYSPAELLKQHPLENNK